jgi:hypothetical protein
MKEEKYYDSNEEFEKEEELYTFAFAGWVCVAIGIIILVV